MRQALHQAYATVMPNENIGDSAELAFVPRNCCAIKGRNCARSAQAVEFGGGGSRTEVGHVGHVCRLAGAPNPVEKHTTRLALLNFRGRFVAVEPMLNGLAFEGFIELLSRLLGLDHRFIHTRLMGLCLFIPVSVESAQPHPRPRNNGEFEAEEERSNRTIAARLTLTPRFNEVASVRVTSKPLQRFASSALLATFAEARG